MNLIKQGKSTDQKHLVWITGNRKFCFFKILSLPIINIGEEKFGELEKDTEIRFRFHSREEKEEVKQAFLKKGFKIRDNSGSLKTTRKEKLWISTMEINKENYIQKLNSNWVEDFLLNVESEQDTSKIKTVLKELREFGYKTLYVIIKNEETLETIIM